MRKFKHVISLILVFALLLPLLSQTGFAQNNQYEMLEPVSVSRINPLYEGLISEDILNQKTVNQAVTAEDVVYYTNYQDAGKVIQKAMKARQVVITLGFKTTNYSDDQAQALFDNIFDAGLVHTGVPTEGDYLHWHYARWVGELNGYISGGTYYLTLTYVVTYNTTAAQEQKMNTAVNNVLSSLNLQGKSDYDKVRAIYDYICANVTYDYANLYDDTHLLKYTAYAALVNKTAVCQGYALLFYRLALELGIDARFIGGVGGGGPHAWNIVELDNLYYNLDSTWDAGESTYYYFLKSNNNFVDHTRDPEFRTSSFNAAHPMSNKDYDPATAPKLEGLNCVDGIWGYYTNGKLDTSYTNMVFYEGIYYYVENGLINWDYVGLAQHKETEIWYYVQGGGVDRSFTGLTMYNGRWFYLEAGTITWSYTGLVEFEGNWYYVQYSQLNFDYTGLVLHGDVWYYVQNSMLIWDQYTLVNHGGTWYYVQNSMLQWNYYGLVNYNGVWYYLENSQITWNFTDLVLYYDVWYYVKGSTIAWDYTGVVPFNGGMYYVENGTINWGYYGNFTQNGVTYTIENGTVVA